MRLTTLLVSGLLAVLASAQTTPSSTATTLETVTSTSSTAAQTSQSEIEKCIDACPAGDVGCTSKCIAVPNPDPAAVNATNECVAACPQGNGTATDNLNYRDCVDACIGKYYFTTTATGATPATTASGSVVTTTDGSGATVTSTLAASGTTASASGSAAAGTGTGTAAPSSTNKAAGEALRAGSAVGLVGVVAAALLAV